MRVPWLVVGVGSGFVCMALLLPTVSDFTGTIQSVVIVGSLLGGLFLGFILDDINRPKSPEDSMPNS
jgi:hypothetical protein